MENTYFLHQVVHFELRYRGGIVILLFTFMEPVQLLAVEFDFFSLGSNTANPNGVIQILSSYKFQSVTIKVQIYAYTTTTVIH